MEVLFFLLSYWDRAGRSEGKKVALNKSKIKLNLTIKKLKMKEETVQYNRVMEKSGRSVFKSCLKHFLLKDTVRHWKNHLT